MTDERIVKMSFDNERFEKNAKTTMSTLDKLKEKTSFKGAAQGLTEMSNAVADTSAYEHLASAVDKISDRFSAWGIVGMRVIENITDSVMNLAKKGLNFLTGGIIQGGKKRAFNLENAHFQLQGLLKDETKVTAVMQNVNDAVDGTAYGLDEAALAASQFAASGLEAGDKMYRALHGVAGVAAMTNSSYSDIAEIFTTISGNGRLMTEQLRQFSARGLNVAATLAEVLGKSEAEVREMVTKGKIDFQTFADAMDSAFGEHAQKANETFNGAMSNVRSALGRIGALFVSPLIEQNGPLVQLLNTVRLQINDIKTNLVPIAEVLTNRINKGILMINDSLKKIDFLKNKDETGNRLNTINRLINATLNIFRALKSVISPITKEFTTFVNRLTLFATGTTGVSGIINGFTNALLKLSQKLILTREESEAVGKFFNGLFRVTSSLVKVFLNLISPLGKVTDKFKGLRGSFFDVLGRIGDDLNALGYKLGDSGLLKTIRDLSQGFFDLVGNLGLFDSIANAVSKAAGAMSQVLKSAGSKIGEFFRAILSGVNELFSNGNLKMALNGGILIALTTGIKRILIQVNRLKGFLADTPWGVAAGNISSAFDKLRGALSSWESNLDANYFIKMASAIAILTASLYALSSIDIKDLASGLLGMQALFQEFILALSEIGGLKLNEKGLRTVTGSMIKFATSIAILAVAVKMLSDIDLKDLAKGVGALGVMMLELVGALALLSTIHKRIKTTAKQMTKLAEAMLILAVAVKMLSGLEWIELAKGLSAVGVLLLEVVGFMALMQNINTSGMGKLIVLSSALLVLSGVMRILGGMSAENILKSVVALGSMLLILAGAMEGMQGGVGGAAALIVMAAAITVLVPALTALGILPIETIVKGLAALAATFVVMGVAAEFIGPMATNVLLLAAGLAAVGIAVGAASAGLAMLLTVLAASPGAIGLFVTAIQLTIQALIGFIPAIVKAIGEGIVLLIKTLANSAVEIAKVIFDAIRNVLDILVEYLPEFIEKGAQVVVAFIEGLTSKVPEMVAAAIEMIVTFISSLATSIEENKERLSVAIGNLINSAISLAISLLVNTVPMLFQKGIELISGLVRGIKSTIGQVASNIRTGVQNAVQAIREKISSFVSAGADVIAGFVRGIRNGFGQIWSAARDLGNNLLSGIKSKLKINSPSKELEDVGMYSDKGLANGVVKFATLVDKAGSKVGDTLLNSVSDSLKNVADLVDSDMEISPTITPVLDLSNVQNGAGAISNLLNGMPNVGSISAAMSRPRASLDDILSGISVKDSAAGTVVNIYPQTLDQATIDYIMAKFNTGLGAVI